MSILSDTEIEKSGLDFAVIGIGASAGGLGAIMRFFEHMPAENGMAFVIVVHLSPKHESNLAELLKNNTKMRVLQVTETVAIEKQTVYVIPPSKSLLMQDGKLVIEDMKRPIGRHIAIDVFLRTLAEAHCENAIGIIMSGTGSDGAVGLTRIKECGGLAIAQFPGDAEYEDMPRRAIETGAIDFILPVVEMPQKLIELTKNAALIVLPDAKSADISAGAEPDAYSEKAAAQALTAVMDLLRTRTGHDFSHYKKATVLRRIERRMQVNCVSNLPDYLAHFEQNQGETQPLLQDMLISVTNFFRDRESFEALERDIIPKIFSDFPEDTIRAWSAGCASGEETYSTAILLAEQRSLVGSIRGLQIFATDIDERAIRTARAGLFPLSIVTDVTPGRLRQFFTKEGKHYQVKKEIRESILFASHNILRDPPFSRVHLIVCRNLLIYLDKEVQERIFAMFHFALHPGGYLFLGSSESADAASKYFTVVDKKHRIYKAIATSSNSHYVPSIPYRRTSMSSAEKMQELEPKVHVPFADLHQRMLEKYAAPSILVDREYDIVHTSARASRFLRYADGPPSHNLIALIIPELRLELRTALFQAVQKGVTVETGPIDLPADNIALNLSIFPVKENDVSGELFLIIFNETRIDPQNVVSREGVSFIEQQLERELQVSKDQLQSTVEQYETSVEELKASNEELQAINEELRSATEELETSKEEGQSINEELITVNHELKMKVEETGKSNEDLQNFVAASDIATIFVDRGMRIKRYTPRAADIFNLILSDIGRPLLDITHRLVYDDLENDASSVLETLHASERQVASVDGERFIVRLFPYRTLEDRIDGLVLTFVDITALHLAQEKLREEEQRMQLIASSAKDYAIITLDSVGLVTSWNEGANKIFGYKEKEMLGNSLDAIFTPEDRANSVPAKEILTAKQEGRAIDERWHLRKDGSRFFCSGVMNVLGDGEIRGYVKIARDLTDTKLQESRREEMLVREQAVRRKAEEASRMREEFLAILSHELKQPLNLIHMNAELLRRSSEFSDSPRLGRIAEAVHNSSNTLSKIIDDLLDLSRINTGKLVLNKSEVDIARTLADIVQATGKTAAEKNITLIDDTVEKSLLLCADATRLEQIIWNLLSNAIKFTPRDGTVHVVCFRDGDVVRLTVKDNGKGISSEHLTSVFDMFNQVDGSSTRENGGLGIGLALVKQLVESHGGGVSVVSGGVGQGSEFRMWMPLDGPELKTGRSMPEIAGERMGALRLLLVDDDIDALDALSELLQTQGIGIVRAQGGAAALERLAEGMVDVIVTDIGMPGMDGYALAGEIRRRYPLANVPIIALSGFGSPADVRKSLQNGLMAHLKKPVDLDELLTELQRLMDAFPRN